MNCSGAAFHSSRNFPVRMMEVCRHMFRCETLMSDLIYMYTYPCRKFCTHFPEFPPTACLCLSAQRMKPYRCMIAGAVKRLITPSQVKGGFILTIQCCIDGWGRKAIIYLKGQWQVELYEEVWEAGTAIISPSGQTLMGQTESRGLLRQPFSAE